ncbi:hypothetical protein [Lentzea guizhouensis]|nr:hypothetical protein [Lentzea guizhouensis]
MAASVTGDRLDVPRTGAGPMEFLLFGATLVAAGAMARRGARRVES